MTLHDPKEPVDTDAQSPRGDETGAGLSPSTDPKPADSSSAAADPMPIEAAILSYESRTNPDAALPGDYAVGVTPEAQASGVRVGRVADPDLRVPWGWLDLLLLVIVYIGATVFATILLAILFAANGVAFPQIQHSPRYMGFFVVTDQLIVSILALLYLWLQTRVRFNAPFWNTLGWRKFEASLRLPAMTYLGLIAFGACLAASVQLVSAVFPARGKLPIENVLQSREAALALMIMSVVLAPVVEETIFRGYIYPVVARSFGVAAGIVGTGALFGLLHAEQLWGGWAQIALLVVVGIVFTWIRAAKRTVMASYLLHVSYNSLLFLAFLFSAHGFRSLQR